MKTTLCLFMALGMVGLTGCTSVPDTVEKKDILSAEVREAVAVFHEKDPTLERVMERSYGYAVIPKIIKGAFWVGGAYGNGQVFERGSMIGYCGMSQASLGFSFGGQYYREIICFRDRETLNKFKMGEFAFSAQVTGVVLTTGVASKSDYHNGVIVFIMAEKGLMIDASLGGQTFIFTPE